ncbi:MAG: hypothetical protein LBU03_01785 [Tannerellaceae bacterium]|jgi:hypothetical protein|nr:hypothetical protein [Tannerellaceae bacterium]
MRAMMCIVTGIVAVVLIGLIFISCEKGEKIKSGEISVDKTEMTFTQEKESQEFNISCIGKWALRNEELDHYLGPNMAKLHDFIISPVSGRGNTTVTVTLKRMPSESYEMEMEIVGGDSPVIVKLKTIVD